MKKLSLYISSALILALFIAIFFFKIIPVPVESIQGNLDTTRFYFGGLYWTSLSYEFSVGDYLGFICAIVLFILLEIGVVVLYRINKI